VPDVVIFALILDASLIARTAISVIAPSMSALPVTVTLLSPLKADAKLIVSPSNVLAPLVTIPPAAV